MCEHHEDGGDTHYGLGFEDGYEHGFEDGRIWEREIDDEIITGQFNELVRLQDVRETLSISLAFNLGQLSAIIALLGTVAIYLGY